MSVLSAVKSRVEGLFDYGHARTAKARKNIAGLFVLRGVTVAVNFLLVPLTLHYLNPVRYGIWLTLSSIVSWVAFMDVGLGNGMRNKFAEALARGDEPLARSYVSTAYAVVAVIIGGAIVLFAAINPFLSWASILNSSPEMGSELSVLALVVFTFFALRLVFGLIGTLLLAVQRPAAGSALEAATSVLSLAAVYLLTRISSGSLFWLGSSVSIIAALVPLGASIVFFRGKYRKFAPARRFIDMSHARELANIGIQFFILQLAGIVLFSTANIIITQLFGPTEVTPYNIALKYYGIALTGFTILVTPFWSAYTDAYTRGDIAWIVRARNKLVRYWLLLVAGLVVMTLLSGPVYRFWVGGEIRIPIWLSVIVGCYVAIVAWSNIFAYFMNSTGQIRLQLWVALTISLLNVPFAVFLATTMGLKSTGVVLATSLCLLPGCILWPLQMKKILGKTATGIWVK